ncbi:MAG: lysophospholipid acyltransferase family protein [Candidatus Omnitrophica bacterium]|nr:lysophospholipid acyltransferase family protein [Candidatus Omnitrophota bacterium]MCG2703993.1 lysophospholipid acyltransferase family protein [Candidatus Omnitrophota bacterium]
MTLPLRAAYRAAVFLSGFKFFFRREEREAIIANLKQIVGENNAAIIKYPRQIYANFGKYLVDFFRADKVNKEFIEKYVRIEQIHHIDNALKKGKGAIGLTAHFGNWELCAQILAVIGYKMNAVALTHMHPRIDTFFTRQRSVSGVNVVPVGVSVRQCFAGLKRNEIVGILGDRDFSGEHGITVDFLGKTLLAPRGPAVLSLRTGAAIVPAFVVRHEEDDRCFTYRFEEPIYPRKSGDEERDIRTITEKYIKVIEQYIRQYPKQWFMFREFWKAEKVEIF